MYWKKYREEDGSYIKTNTPEITYCLNTDSEEEQIDYHGWSLMDDELFDIGFDGCYYLKTFLASPNEVYLERKKKFENNQEIATLKSYLDSTDYVIAKLNELKLEDEVEFEKAKEEYKEVLTKRKEARERINKLGGQDYGGRHQTQIQGRVR